MEIPTPELLAEHLVSKKQGETSQPATEEEAEEGDVRKTCKGTLFPIHRT